MRTLFAIPLTLIVLACLSSCSNVNLGLAASAGAKAIQAANISDEYINQLVSQYIQQLDAESVVAASNDPYAVRLNRITQSFNNKDGINIKVYKTNDVNAFAVADGSVRVYSGLMDIMSDEEILGVVGHEIGHVRNKDTRDAFRNALLASAVRDGLASTGGVIGTLSASEVGAISETLVNSQYSQKQESEADEYGYQFLKSHGVNPWAMAMSLEKLYQMEQQGGARTKGMEQLFSTHPDLAKRIKKMSDKARKDGFARPAVNTAQTNYGTSVPANSNAVSSSQWSF